VARQQFEAASSRYAWMRLVALACGAAGIGLGPLLGSAIVRKAMQTALCGVVGSVATASAQASPLQQTPPGADQKDSQSPFASRVPLAALARALGAAGLAGGLAGALATAGRA
jgi:hypothetical protein